MTSKWNPRGAPYIFGKGVATYIIAVIRCVVTPVCTVGPTRTFFPLSHGVHGHKTEACFLVAAYLRALPSKLEDLVEDCCIKINCQWPVRPKKVSVAKR